MENRDANWAVEAYERVRAQLPKATFPPTPQIVGSLVDLCDRFDVFLLDAFGVLNVGNSPIATAPDVVAHLQKAGKRVMVLTNGATHPTHQAVEKFTRLGFSFRPTDVVSSRDALRLYLAKAKLDAKGQGVWGVMAARSSEIDELPVPTIGLSEDRRDFDAACGFILLSTSEWTPQRQEMLRQSLATNPRPLLVGNPDIVAPREDGLSLEPGHFAYQLAQEVGITPKFFGKPFANIFDLAFSRLGSAERSRVLMVGDSLHTDILGGAAYGVSTALVTGHGLFAGCDYQPFSRLCGIQPDYVMESP